jgi:hypothetical protein
MIYKEDNKMKLYMVGIYKVDRAFGGHEEGGWWFDFGELQRRSPKTFTEIEKARNYREKLQAKLDRIFNNRGSASDINSVLCDGIIQAEIHQDILPEFWPETTPRYC